MALDAKGTAQEVADLIAPVLEDMGFELVDVEYVSKHGRWVLRLFIDREGGITVDDCAGVSGEIGDVLDVRDIIDHEYVLEVSSPGINRPLKKKKDFQGAAGRKVKLRTIHPREGRRNYEGVLERVEGDMITLLVDGAEVSFSIEEVEKANLVYDF
ncbi:MAG: ribosome maturation factor RimP [Thermodesulfobacteriota bacterium]